MLDTKTYIACRPGLQQQMQAAFAGVTVEVDDSLTVDYEFRQRDLTLDEMLEQEVEKEERQDADPKNALTFITPLVRDYDAAVDGGWLTIKYLAIRLERGPSPYDVRKVIADVKPTLTGSFPDEEVNVSATMSAIRAALKKEGYNVLSVSEAEGLDQMGEA